MCWKEQEQGGKVVELREWLDWRRGTEGVSDNEEQVFMMCSGLQVT